VWFGRQVLAGADLGVDAWDDRREALPRQVHEPDGLFRHGVRGQEVADPPGTIPGVGADQNPRLFAAGPPQSRTKPTH